MFWKVFCTQTQALMVGSSLWDKWAGQVWQCLSSTGTVPSHPSFPCRLSHCRAAPLNAVWGLFGPWASLRVGVNPSQWPSEASATYEDNSLRFGTDLALLSHPSTHGQTSPWDFGDAQLHPSMVLQSWQDHYLCCSCSSKPCLCVCVRGGHTAGCSVAQWSLSSLMRLHCPNLTANPIVMVCTLTALQRRAGLCSTGHPLLWCLLKRDRRCWCIFLGLGASVTMQKRGKGTSEHTPLAGSRAQLLARCPARTAALFSTGLCNCFVPK